MARARAAQRAAAENVAASLTALHSPARAAASRRNGAKSRGPKTADGKARSARNALKHGLCAEKFVVGDEDAREFAALEAALTAELPPEGAVQGLLAGRIVRAAWRLQRADQIEGELFADQMQGPFGDGDLGLALIRDGNGARAFDTLLRYRASAQAELLRTLRTLKALQAGTHATARAQETAPAPLPNQPEPRGIAGESRAAMPAPADAAPAAPEAPPRPANAPLPPHRANPKPAESLAPARPQRPPAGPASAMAGAGSP
jgi:hypothetical protein